MSHENSLPRDVVPDVLRYHVDKLGLDVVDVQGEPHVYRVLLRDGQRLLFVYHGYSTAAFWDVTYDGEDYCITRDEGCAALRRALGRAA